MNTLWISLAFVGILGFNLVSAANILFYWGVSGYSHRISVWPLVEALSEKGHNVTFFSPYESRDPPNPRYTVVDIVPKNLSRDLGYANMDFVENRLKNGPQGAMDLWPEYFKGSLRGCKSILEDPEIIQWAKASTFDLIIMDALLMECGYAFVHQFKAPHIHFSPSTHFPHMLETYRNPDENIPEFQHFYPIDMTLVQRIHNVLSNLSWRWKKYFEFFPYAETLAKKAFGWNETPDFDAIERNVSLVLVSDHHSIDVPRSLPPLFVNVAGMHTKDATNPLPKYISDFIDSGDNGFVLLSFGTYFTLSACPKHLQNIFFNAMSKVNTNFVIKFDGPTPKNMPKNVLPVGWVPQNDILAHPKIRAFISHGGLLGTQEAVYHAVPTVVIPLFAEQDYHSMRLVERGAGISLELSDLTDLKLENAIRQVTSNKTYRENCLRTSTLFKDRLNKPLETAVWWVEYVLRHNGTVNLRPVRINESWFTRRNLDVWGIIALVSLGGFIVLFLLVLRISKRIFKASFGYVSIMKYNLYESTASVLSPGERKKNQ